MLLRKCNYSVLKLIKSVGGKLGYTRVVESSRGALKTRWLDISVSDGVLVEAESG